MATDTVAGLTQLALVHLTERVVAGERFDLATSTRCMFEPGLGLTVGLDVDPAQIDRGLVALCLAYYDPSGDAASPGLHVGDIRVRQVVLPDEYCCHEHQRSQPLLDTADDVLATFRGANWRRGGESAAAPGDGLPEPSAPIVTDSSRRARRAVGCVASAGPRARGRRPRDRQQPAGTTRGGVRRQCGVPGPRGRSPP